MPITPEQQAAIVQLAREHGQDTTNQQIADTYGVSRQRIEAILLAAGIVKPRRATLLSCQKPRCKRKFRGTKQYSGAKARYCDNHRGRKQ